MFFKLGQYESIIGTILRVNLRGQAPNSWYFPNQSHMSHSRPTAALDDACTRSLSALRSDALLELRDVNEKETKCSR